MSPFLELMDIFAIFLKFSPKGFFFFFFLHEKVLLNQQCILQLEEIHFSRWAVGRNSSVQFSSVAQSCLTLGDPMNHGTPGLPAHHQLPESTQTHVHCVGDAIQSSHPLSSPSPPALNLSQYQGLFK